MPRAINPRIDALFVEGPDDGAVVNAFVSKLAATELGRPPYLVRTRDDGGGASWALRAFEEHTARALEGARVGLILDRDGSDRRPDNWPAVRSLLRRLGETADAPSPRGHIIGGRVGVWMWPDNVTVGGDLESFLAGLVPVEPILAYATEASRVAKEVHGAEYQLAHAPKAALKIRSIWRDASAAGGYGHLVRNLPLVDTLASKAFLDWFTRLFLT